MSMISCPHCQRQSPDDARFCPYCGREITIPGGQVEEEITPATARTGEDSIEATAASNATVEEDQTLLMPQEAQEEHTVLASEPPQEEEGRDPDPQPPQEEREPPASQTESKKEDATPSEVGEDAAVFNLADVQQEEEKTILAQPIQAYASTPVISYDMGEVENPYEAPIYYEEPQPLYYEEEPRPVLTHDEPIENPYESPLSYQSSQATSYSTLPATPQPLAVPGESMELDQYAATPVPSALADVDTQTIQPGAIAVPPPPKKPLWLRRPILTASLLLLILVIIAGTVFQFSQGNPIKRITNYFLPKTIIAVTTTNIYALNADDGKQLWQKPISGISDGTTQPNILLEDGILYVVGKTVSALDMKTGESKWSVAGVVEGDFPQLHLYEDILYVTGDSQIAAYNAGNGSMLWSRTIDEQDGFIGYFSFLGQSICFQDNNKLYVIDAKTGNTKLIHDLIRDAPRGNPNGFWSSLIIPLGEKHIVLNWTDLLENRGSVVAIDIQSGNMAWRLDGNSHLFYLPDLDMTKKRNDKLYLYEFKAERDFTFSAYNVQGAALWAKSIGDGDVNVQGDQVYMAGSKQLQKWNLNDGNQIWSATSPGVQKSDYHSFSVSGSTLAVNVGEEVFGYDTNTAGQKWKVPASSLIEVGPNQTFNMLTRKNHILFSVTEPDGQSFKVLGKLGVIHPDTGKARWKADLSGNLTLVTAN